MAEQLPPNSSFPPEVRESLQKVSRLLHEARHLGPEAQRTLADLVDELANALAAGGVSAAEAAHLSERTARLLEAVEGQHDEGVLNAARERLEEAVVGAESRAPVVAGVARRLLDALANLGI